jgi:hypothetical protein
MSKTPRQEIPLQEIPRFEALVVPNEALDRGGVEVLRASIIDGELHVTLRRTFEQPEHWGGLLAEVVRRIARAYAVDGKMDEGLVVFQIRSSFATEEVPARARASKPKKKRMAKMKKPAKKRAAKRKKR